MTNKQELVITIKFLCRWILWIPLFLLLNICAIVGVACEKVFDLILEYQDWLDEDYE